MGTIGPTGSGGGGYISGHQPQNTPPSDARADEQTSLALIYNWFVKTYGATEGAKRFQEFMEPIENGEKTLMQSMQKMLVEEIDEEKQTQLKSLIKETST